jgi:hypothetical protein
LVLLLVPTCLVEPLKLVALAVAGEWSLDYGHVHDRGAYATSLLLVERLFRIVKPKLLTLPWFARIWDWVVALRAQLLVGFGEPDRARAVSAHRVT